MSQPATPPSASAGPPWPPAGVAWYAVVVLFAAFILSFIARLIVSLLVPSLKLPPEQGGLGLSDADIGVLQGPGFVLFYAWAGRWASTRPAGWSAPGLRSSLAGS